MKRVETEFYNLFCSKEALEAVGVDFANIYERIDSANKKGSCKDKVDMTALLTMEQAAALIPVGNHCYKSSKDGKRLNSCPFYDRFPHLPPQGNGFCHYLKEGDFTRNSTGLLWDRCKCCGVNDEVEETV